MTMREFTVQLEALAWVGVAEPEGTSMNRAAVVLCTVVGLLKSCDDAALVELAKMAQDVSRRALARIEKTENVDAVVH